MRVSFEAMEGMKQRYKAMFSHLDERQRRLWCAAEAQAAGRGGVSAVARVTGLSRQTITQGLHVLAGSESEQGAASAARVGKRRIRAPGAGRKPIIEKDPLVLTDLDALVDPVTRGDPQSPLRWTCKSTAQLAAALRRRGHPIGPRTVAKLLHGLDYSLQSNRKIREGSDHPDRNAQFQHISKRATDFSKSGEPVVSVDAKKKELVGQFRNGGREWRPRGVPFEVNVHDFPDDAVGKAIPYGVYDIYRNEGWVSVGIDHNTADFAVASIRSWWYEVGRVAYPEASALLITADCGGSNGNRSRAWKVGLQRLADETGLAINVCHFPPGTSKWNKIEHRMFCHITRNWRGQPLVSHDLVLNLIAGTTTSKGLHIQAAMDSGTYPTGISIPDAEMKRLNIERDDFHGEWNYTIHPRE